MNEQWQMPELLTAWQAVNNTPMAPAAADVIEEALIAANYRITELTAWRPIDPNDDTTLPPNLSRVWVTQASGNVLDCQIIKSKIFTYRTGQEVRTAIAWVQYKPAPYKEVDK